MRRRAMCAQPRRSVARGQGRRNGGQVGWAGSCAKEGQRHEQGSALPWARGGAHTRTGPWPSEAARGRAAKWPRRRWVKEAAGCVVPWRRVDGLLHKTGVGGPRGLATRFLGGRGTPAAHKGKARSSGTAAYLSDWGRTWLRRGEVRPWRFDAMQAAQDRRCSRSWAPARRRAPAAAASFSSWRSSPPSSSLLLPPLRVLLFSPLLCFSGGGGRKGKFPWL